MNILLLNEYGTVVGGAETHIRYLYDALEKGGNELFLFCSDRNRDGTELIPRKNIIFSRHPSNPLSRIRNKHAARGIARVVKERNIDLIHGHNIFSTISPYFLKDCTVPTVITLHDYQIICPKSTMFHPRTNLPCYKCDMRECLGSVKYYYESAKRKRWDGYLGKVPYISPSRYLEKAVREKGITNITTIHNGVPPLQGPDGDMIRKVSDERDEFHLVFTGRLYPEKGVASLLKAFVGFLKDKGGKERVAKKIKLSITGEGPLRDLVADYSRKYEEIEYLGFVSRERMNRLLRSATYLILPSLWPENCSMAVLEAMRYGIPVIASDMGGTPELVRDGKEGYLMDIASALSRCEGSGDRGPVVKRINETFERAFSAPGKRRTMSQNSLKAVEKRFSADIMAGKIRKVYEDLLGT